MNTNQIIHADVYEALPTIPNNFFDLVITSPPYFVGKEYEVGMTWDEYQELMKLSYYHVARTLKPGGYFVINFGDCHNKDGRFYATEIPSRFPMSGLHYDWGRDSLLDLQSIRIWKKNFARVALGFVVNHRPVAGFEHEHIWTWRKQGGDKKEFCNDRKLSQRSVWGEGWTSPAKIDKHCAAFPIELPLTAIDVYIKRGTEANSIVGDIFGGSGTTVAAAIRRDCQWLMIERDAGYIEYAKERIEKEKAAL